MEKHPSKENRKPIVIVYDIFRGTPARTGAPRKTEVWITGSALKDLEKLATKHRVQVAHFMKKLDRFSTDGFEHHTSAGGPIKPEWNGIYRISDGSLIRLIGFYPSTANRNFIILDSFLKSGQKLSSSDRDRITQVGNRKDQEQYEFDGSTRHECG